MNIQFDFNNISVVEFGVGRDDGAGQAFCCIIVDNHVQNTLREMAESTWTNLQAQTTIPDLYEPTEKYSGCEHVYLPIDNPLAERMRDLHTAENLPIDNDALTDPTGIFCYFTRLTDNNGHRLTALRRASQFKGVLKSRLVRIVSDALKLIEDKVFKLDIDFDLLVDAHRLHIMRPSGFEFAGNLQQAILDAVPRNIQAIEQDIPFVNFKTIEEYARTHPRAARYLASIRAKTETRNISRRLLAELCRSTGVEIHESESMITVQDGHVMGFLEVMDRRRYELELVEGSPEQFRAASRSRLQNQFGGGS